MQIKTVYSNDGKLDSIYLNRGGIEDAAWASLPFNPTTKIFTPTNELEFQLLAEAQSLPEWETLNLSDHPPSSAPKLTPFSNLDHITRHQIYRDTSANTINCLPNIRTKIPILGSDPVSGTLAGIPDNFSWDKTNHRLIPSLVGGDPSAYSYRTRFIFDTIPVVKNQIKLLPEPIKLIFDASAIGGKNYMFADTRYLHDKSLHPFGFYFPLFIGNLFTQNGCDFGITPSAEIIVSNVSLYISRTLVI